MRVGRPLYRGFSKVNDYMVHDFSLLEVSPDGDHTVVEHVKQNDRCYPAALREEKGRWSVVPLEESTHVFMFARANGPPDGTEVVLDWFGVLVRASAIEIRGVTCYYFYNNQVLMPKTPEVNILLSRHFTGYYESVNWNDPASDEQLFRRRDLTGVGRSIGFDEAINLPVSAITQDHHSHFKLCDFVRDMPADELAEIKDLYSVPHDASQAHAVGVFLWLYLADPDVRNKVMDTGIFQAGTTEEYKKLAKALSVEAKSLQNLVKRDLRQVFELEVLVNRNEGDLDWEQEKDNRVNVKAAELDPDYVRSEARVVFLRALREGKKYSRLKWSEFWETRWEWAASGSVHVTDKRDDAYIIKDDRATKNKFITIANMPKKDFRYFSQRKPALSARSSTKYEWSKKRAIYGTDLVSYIVASFCMPKCENLLPRQFPVGKAANDSNVSRRVNGVLAGRLPFCLDFEDFNSQHSIDSMKAVLLAFNDVHFTSMDEEQREALGWTINSLDNMKIVDNVGTKTQYAANGTLLSGWRLTTFMNSVLNYIYVQKIRPPKPYQDPSVHNGDDVLMGVESFGDVIHMLKKAKQHKIRIQKTKCAYGGIAEFLRIDHQKGSRGQYLSRSIATIAHSRVESRPNPDICDLLEAMENRLRDLKDRGGNLSKIATLRHIYYKTESKITSVPVEHMYLMKTSHRVVGGMSEDPYSSVEYRIRRKPIGRSNLEQETIEKINRLPAISDYVEVVARKLDVTVDRVKATKRLRTATIRAIESSNKIIEVEDNTDYARSIIEKRIFKAHQGTLHVANYGKAVLTGLRLEVLGATIGTGALRELLKNARDPFRTMEIVL